MATLDCGGQRMIKESTTKVLFGSRTAFKDLPPSVQELEFPSSQDFPSFLADLAVNGEQIESIFMSTKPSSNSDFCKFMATSSLFSNLKSLVITGSGRVDEGGFEIPIEAMTEFLRVSPQLETFEILNYVRMGTSFSFFSMFSFSQALRLHSSLRNFKFEPMAQIKIHHPTCEYTGRANGRPHIDGYFFNLDLILGALAETPNLQHLRLRPSLYDVENNDLWSYRGEGGEHIELYQKIPISSLTALCSNPALLELEIDFRSEWSRSNEPWDLGRYGTYLGRHGTYWLTVQKSSDRERFTEALGSSSLSKFIYRHMAIDDGGVAPIGADEPITLDVLKAMKSNTKLSNVCVEQQFTQQKPGVFQALTEVLRESQTLAELHLPFLKLCHSEKSCSMKPIAESLKDNQTLRVLNLRGSNFTGTNKGNFTTYGDRKATFEHVLTSNPSSVVYNTTLLSLETGCCEEGEMKDDDSRDYYCDDYEVTEYYAAVDLGLVLNRVGRRELFNDVAPTKAGLVAALSEVPSACRDYVPSDDRWFEPEDITTATYYILRKFPGVWAPSRRSSQQTVSVTATPPKKKKRRQNPVKK